ncbi:hypothetical protein ACETRX_03430 [Labrys portucalensis]|uniref:Uncharacterized protein n=1 Tax=Labrys neptuniae TaxID=376174 RepID=A0ABV6Z8X7_9HYPH
MTRSILMGLVAAASITGTSVALPLIPPPANDGSSVIQVRYHGGCPPGYKVTSHGGCKLSHYLRRHPGQNPNNYYYEERPSFGFGFGYRSYHHRRYYDDGY